MSRIPDPRKSRPDAVPEPCAPAPLEPASGAGKKILIIQSAHPNYVLRALEWLEGHPIPEDPRYSLLCRARPEILANFQDHPMITSIHGHSGIRTSWQLLRSLRAEKYDTLVLFFTGEPGHGKIMGFSFLLGIRRKLVFNERIECSDLTWKATLKQFLHSFRPMPGAAGRHRMRRMISARARLRPRLLRPTPREQRESYPGERILLLQTAGPAAVLRALDRLRQAPLFSNPRYSLFCRAFPEVLEQFRNHPMLFETRIHTSTRRSWEHLRSLRHENFDAAVFFLTGEPGYWKIKCFAFLLGVRHKVIFNENNDCFYFSWKSWSNLLAHRMTGSLKAADRTHRGSRAAATFLVLIKALFLPLRVAWLLIVWLRLRANAMQSES